MVATSYEPAEGSRTPRACTGVRGVEGGLLFAVLRRMRLTDAALGHLGRRVVVVVLIAWLPLLVLSALGGHALGDGLVVPFLLDVETHVRFLVALPLLLVAEVETFRRAPPIFRQFVERRLVPESALPRFEAIVASTQRLRNAWLAEVLLLVAVYAIGTVAWQRLRGLRHRRRGMRRPRRTDPRRRLPECGTPTSAFRSCSS